MLDKIVEKYLGKSGRMISGSKSIYIYDNPDNFVIFNANIFTKKSKIWYGDLDVTKDSKVLKELSKELKEPLYILYEMDGRFENEKKPNLKNSYFILKNGEIEIKSEYARLVKGVIKKKKFKPKYDLKPAEYDKNHFKETMLLPDLKKIKVKRGYSVIEKFQLEIIKLNGRSKAEENYLSMYVHEDYYRELESLIKRELEKGFPDLHPAKINQTIAGEMLDGPMEFQNKPRWVKKNLGYIRNVNGN